MLSITSNNLNGNSSSSSSSSQTSSRLQQLSRASLNLVLAKQSQQQQLSNIDGPASASGNLSPSILINAENGSGSSVILTSINNALTVRNPLASGSQPGRVEVSVTPQVKPAEPPPLPPSSSLLETTQPDTTTKNAADVKKCTNLGDYVFFEPALSTDTFGTAFNTKTRLPYLWKKFERRDYMKKLEAYFIMEGSSDKIYKFSEIILQSNFTGEQDQEAVFVLFEPHFGDLHSFMKEKKRLEEPEARLIFRQCVEAVHACHQNGIIIRDIKLKKFVFLDAERSKIGLANLEDSLLLDQDAENDLIKSQQGCPAYVSPEVLNPIQTSYSGVLSDSWSLGIILYTLLVGRYPFHHPTIANMFARIARGKFQVPMPISLSLDARILLRSLIRVKPDERLRPDEILASNWFRLNEAECRAQTMRSLFASSPMSAAASPAASNSKKVSKLQPGISSPLVSSVCDREDACVPQLAE